MKGLIVEPSPHRYEKVNSTQAIMMKVIFALLPTSVMGCLIFGIHAVAVIAVCVASCVFFEAVTRIIMHKPQTIGDMSAVVTGLLLALNLPSSIPLWMAVVGSFIAIVMVKQLFGGIGQNFANPAIVGRIFMMISFSSAMTNWVKPYWYFDSDDVVTCATPLAQLSDLITSATSSSQITEKTDYLDLFLGNCGGCIGEVCAVALLIGGIYLIIDNVISPATPIAFIGTVAFLFWVSGGDVLYQVLSGGLIIGAFFMATDYSTTPLTRTGKIVFGIGCGIITFVIRSYGAYPEGVSFSILIMNLLTPYIDRLTETRPLGAKPKEKGGN